MGTSDYMILYCFILDF